MSKISYYSKRSGGQSYPNYSYSNHPGYIHTHKKNYNYFKPRTKYNIPPSNTYFEERNKNYIYHNNFGDNNFHNNFFQKKNYSNRYTSYPYSSEENKVEEEVISEPEKEEPKEEIMRINLNVGENGNKKEKEELPEYTKDIIRVKLEFCDGWIHKSHIKKLISFEEREKQKDKDKEKKK